MGNQDWKTEVNWSPSPAELAAYKSAITLAISDVVERLRDTLGAGVVAELAGVNETRAVNQWADGQREVRSRMVQARLRLAHQLVEILAQEWSPEVAEAWFTNGSPVLGYKTPVRFLAEGDPTQVAPVLVRAAAAVAAA